MINKCFFVALYLTFNNAFEKRKNTITNKMKKKLTLTFLVLIVSLPLSFRITTEVFY